MNGDYGELMSFLIERKDRFDTDEKFRAFVIDSLRTFARDLRDMNVEITLKPDVFRIARPSGDWNSLKIGCE